MDEKQLKALIKKTAAKAERAKPKKRRIYDDTLAATRPAETDEAEAAASDELGDADQIFREMKRREF